MTTRSANPRRFSRGDDLNPRAELNVYMGLVVEKTPESFREAFRAVARYHQDWPQAVVALVAMRDMGDSAHIVIEVSMGQARSAMSGESVRVKAGYGFLHSVAKGLFQLRPAFVSPPTDSERDAFSQITLPQRTRPAALASLDEKGEKNV